MCGIFAYLSNKSFTQKDICEMTEIAAKIKHRGPDETIMQTIAENTVFLAFHRLKITDLSQLGSQPFNKGNMWSMCNGELYNHAKLTQKYSLDVVSSCDCEVIIPMCNKVGILDTCCELDGVFAFTVFDDISNVMWLGRDPFGVRPLYYGTNTNGEMIISSELKAIPSGFTAQVFPPGNYGKVVLIGNKWELEYVKPYYTHSFKQNTIGEQSLITQNIKELMAQAVEKRMMSDRPIGCLLSGGLDSSIIASLLSSKLKEKGQRLHTFSVGLKGSEDLKYAKLMADYLGCEHTSLIISEKDMLDAIPEDIYITETYDTTTIRASTPMYLLCKHIKEKTDITVIFSGEGSDEASGSYMYFHNAPCPEAFQEESERLMKDLHYFDVLRCDKSSAGAGLEIRVPFLDLNFIYFYMGIDPKLKMTSGKIEKRLLRETFKDILPDIITWRQKEGMSDGVSCKQKSWAKTIQDHVETIKLDIEPQSHNPPLTSESRYYRQIFNKHFTNRDYLIPYYWMPKWCGNMTDPSARLLDVYN